MLFDKHGIRQYQFSATFIFFYTTAKWKEMSGFAYIAAAPRWWLCYHPASVTENWLQQIACYCTPQLVESSGLLNF